MNKIIQAFGFCPRCGKEFSIKKGELLGCSACGLRYYISPKPCAGIIPINEKGELLLTTRALDPHKGKLDILGGFVQEGETLEQGVQREAREELGLTIKTMRYITSYTHDYMYQDIAYSLVTAIFSTSVEGNLSLNVADDVASYDFFNPSDISLEMLAFPQLKEIIDSLFS